MQENQFQGCGNSADICSTEIMQKVPNKNKDVENV